MLLWTQLLSAQCPQLFDGSGNPSSTPVYLNCSGGPYTVFIQSPNNIGTYTIDWGDGSPADNGVSLIPPAFVSHNYPAGFNVYNIVFTETSSGCVINGQVIIETTVSASIQIPAGSPVYGCAPASFDFLNSSTNVSSTTTFTWDFGDGSPQQIFNSTNAGQVISHTYLPGTVNCDVAVTLTAQNYCNASNPSVAVYQPIQVWDKDDANITPDYSTLCFPDNVVHYDNTTNLNCFALGNTSQRFEYWNFGDYWGLGHDSVVAWQPFNPPTRPGYDVAYPGIGSYDVMLIDSSYCGLDTAIITIQIIPPPVAGLDALPDTICEGASITFQNLSTGGANSFSWNFGDGSPAQNTGSMANVSHTYNNAGDYTVTLTATITGATPGCTDNAQIQIHVKPGPTAAFSIDNNPFCDTGTVNFTESSVNAVIWDWDFGNGNVSNLQNPPPQFYTGTGNYNATLNVTAANGCTDQAATTINVYQSPTVQFTPNAVCQGQLTQFSDASVSSPGDPIISWNWNFGDGGAVSTIQNSVYQYNTAGTFQLILSVATANCSNTDTFALQVNPLPVAAFNATPLSGCTPLQVDFTDNSTGAVHWDWNFGDGSLTDTLQNPSHDYINPLSNDVTDNVSLVVTNIFGCTDTAFSAVTVFAAAQATFTSNAVPGCSPLPVNFNNTSTGATTFQWDFGDGSAVSTQNSPIHLFSNTTPFIQFYTTTLVVYSANGCTDTTSQQITAFPEPDFIITPSVDTGCHALSVSFSPSNGGVIYNWDFGDGVTSTSSNPTHVFTNTGVIDSVYTVTLIATNAFSCVDTAQIPVTVYPLPGASFSASPLLQVYPNATVNLLNTSNGGFTYHWDFGDGTTSPTFNPPAHLYATWGTYQIQLTVFNDHCQDTVSHFITIDPPLPVSSFVLSDTAGCRPFTVSFTNNSLYATSYLWDFGDGGTSTQQDPSYTYYNAGTYIVTLTATGPGGVTNAADTIIVYESPTAYFTLSPNLVYIPNTVYFYNLSTNSTSWQWSFGDGGTSTDYNPEHIYNTTGIYDVTLIAVNDVGCSDSVTVPAAVSAENQGTIVFPNAFTPNTNGPDPNGGRFDPTSLNNDIFFPLFSGVKEYRLLIFDRWGELIFESKDVNIGWDGYYRGKLCQEDVYVWKVVATMLDGSTVKKAGDVTLLVY